jgi:hypothetical protein
MNHEDPTDADLKARFTNLRDAETAGATSFARALAAARLREARPRSTSPLGWTIGALAAAALALLIVPRMAEKAPSPTLAEALPVLLPRSSDSGRLFPSPLFDENRLPSDSVLPLHLDFPL